MIQVPAGLFQTPKIAHCWDLSKKEAIRLQHDLARRVDRKDRIAAFDLAAGVDVAYDETSAKQFSAVVVLDIKTLEICETATASAPIRSPYTPGLFSFRELPTIIEALARLKTTPDVIVCDGHGIAHPRRLGLASHLGVLFDIPTIGCSKTRLTGRADAPGLERGDFSYLVDQDEIIGAVLRTQSGIKPVYVSIGHRVSLATACDLVLRLAPRYRLPETTRRADQAARRFAGRFAGRD